MKETIRNFNLKTELSLGCWKNPPPHWSHLEVEHLPPLRFSENPIISNLIESGYSVHPTITSFFFGFPTREYSLSGHFVAKVQNEFQIDLDDESGFLRFHFDAPGHVFLSLFFINYEKQGQGFGRKHFKPVTDALFRAGVLSMRGKVGESVYPSKRPMILPKLLIFYVLEGGFETDGEGKIWKVSPYVEASVDLAVSPKSVATGILSESEIAMIS